MTTHGHTTGHLEFRCNECSMPLIDMAWIQLVVNDLSTVAIAFVCSAPCLVDYTARVMILENGIHNED